MRWLAILSLTGVIVPACGEHPCTLGVGEPKWCTAIPDDAAPFCDEACSVCEDPTADRWASACRAHCRAEVGMPDKTCEELDGTVEGAYRLCIDTSDHPGCGGHPRGQA